jgi:hypothetical protein
MIEGLQEMLRREPFIPFRIVTTSGDKYQVKDPELVVIMKSQVFIAQPRSDRFALLRNTEIAAIEGRQAAA